MSNFRPIDRQTGFLLPPSVDEWLPEKHLARFVVEVIDGLDLRAMSGSYRGSGSASYHPSLLLGILVYGYATGVFSSRKLERATYDSVAFRFIAANEHPDHDTIATFRRRFLKEIEGLFVQVLVLAREMGVLKMGTVALDGTKIHANASRHSALSYEHAGKIEAQLKAEVAELLAKAEAADRGGRCPTACRSPMNWRGARSGWQSLPRRAPRSRRGPRSASSGSRPSIEAKLAARDAKTAATGRKPGGKPPAAAGRRSRPTDQVNLTDEESRIMPVAGGGFEQCYNAQAVVAAGSLLVVATDVVQAPNDKQQLEPMLEQARPCPRIWASPDTLLADNGYFSEANVTPARRRIEPLIAWARRPPSLPGRALRRGAAGAGEPDAGRGHGAPLQDAEGKKLYALRKQTSEPVFGIIKSVLGFRQFLLRGLDNVRGEWSLVTMAWNMKRMFASASAERAASTSPNRQGRRAKVRAAVIMPATVMIFGAIYCSGWPAEIRNLSPTGC